MIETPPMWFYIAPARQGKFHINKTEAVIQVSGLGPTKVTYVNAADDPLEEVAHHTAGRKARRMPPAARDANGGSA